ncbi:arginase family protein [Dyadobacter arcticus]|uniref:Arginase family enzyme n=1 Tax=Dyadobacter arcticus TaxID=1078754 RepID=A0ABX0UGV6_9BACT|nr:arginase family protein [Dyadobacter arcticus]NIJ52248.1 arginase family enzyme [Dyadobacter arcticus]
MPYAVQRSGFLLQANDKVSVPVDVTDFSPQRATRHDVLNAERIAGYARQLAAALLPVLASGRFPVVLGGDCSILLGCMLAFPEHFQHLQKLLGQQKDLCLKLISCTWTTSISTCGKMAG